MTASDEKGRGPAIAGAPTQKLHKVLAQAGLGSRRQMEEWIRGGRVSVNGVAAGLGARVGREDAIEVDGRPLGMRATEPRLPRVLLYHKPEGEIVSREDPAGRASVFERLPPLRGGKWLAVGRLDFNTSGLLVLTDSGDLANRLAHPRYGLAREYAVRVRGRVAPEQMAALTRGIALEDGSARMEAIEEQGGEGANRWYRIVLHEGRNRIVRRMFEALGLTVSRLMRVRFGPLALPPRLTRGRVQALEPHEVRELLTAVGLTLPERSAKRHGAKPDAGRPRRPPAKARFRKERPRTPFRPSARNSKS
jgi:23S rRNA pseudouridine2605 synthase